MSLQVEAVGELDVSIDRTPNKVFKVEFAFA